ncbi:PAS domain S-box protein [Natronococcus pandeyae]|uniref:PAS domain S-box protein n=1 Tax=Natronococcus pandeyae TaxID=2055836 RepID=UPI001652F993|nr:PAS domain S-box protein [Natronococcus pandeyae]
MAPVSDGLVCLDTGGTIVFVNPSVSKLLGYESEELLERPIDRLFPEAPPDPLGLLVEQAAPPTESHTRDGRKLTLVHRDGHEVPVTLDVNEIEYDHQRFFVAILRDRSGIEEKRRYEAIANTVDDGIYQLDKDGTFVAVNDLIVEATGYEREQLLGAHVSLLLDDDTIDRIERRIRDLLRTGEESTTLDLDVRTANGDLIPYELRMRLLLANDEFVGTVGVVRDISDRLEREREVSRHSAVIESAMDGMGISDETGELRYVNGALAKLHGYDDPEDLVGESWQVLFPDDEARRLEREVLPTVLDRGYWRGEAVGERADGSRFPQEHSLTAHDDGVVCVVRDITARKAREHQLEELNEIARELMSEETHDEIAQTGAEAVEDVLGFEIACVRRFDEKVNQLEPVALTDGARKLLETQTAYDLEATLAGRAFRNEEPLINVVPESDLPEPVSMFEHSSVHVPIGSYGVLSLLVSDDEEFDDSDIHLTEMLAMGIGAALARADRTRLLRTQERELRQQHDQLETLNRINAVNTEISTSLVAATTREELDRTICEHLVGSELYRSAWIGHIEGSGDRIGTAVGVGVEDSYLDTITNTSFSGVAGGAVERVIETHDVQVIRQYQIPGINGTSESEEEREPGEDMEAIAVVPLLYGDRLIGILVLNSVRDEVFCEDAITGFGSLGKIIGFAQNAIKSRELLLADSIVELEFTLRDHSVFYVQVTAELDCRCEFQHAVPIENGRIITYDVISGADPATVLELAEDAPYIERARVVSKQDGEFVLQTVTSRSMVQFALELGTTVQSATADGGEGTVIVEAPQAADIREIVTAFEREFDPLEFVAKREREHSVTSAGEFRAFVADRLTEKQRAALESAYFAGYYDWPRKITAEELADSMEISSSTLHQHLRRGNWCLLSAFFEDQP